MRSRQGSAGTLFEHFIVRARARGHRYGLLRARGHQFLPSAQRHDAVVAAGYLSDLEGQLWANVWPDRTDDFHDVWSVQELVVYLSGDEEMKYWHKVLAEQSKKLGLSRQKKRGREKVGY